MGCMCASIEIFFGCTPQPQAGPLYESLVAVLLHPSCQLAWPGWRVHFREARGLVVQAAHTAMADIKESLEQLRYYKTAIFKHPRRAV